MASIKSCTDIYNSMSMVFQQWHSTIDELSEQISDCFSSQKLDGFKSGLDNINTSLSNIDTSLRNISNFVPTFNSSLSSIDSSGSLEKLELAFGLADEYTINNQKLSMINDGLQSTEELWNKVFDASQRSNIEFTDFVDTMYKADNFIGDIFGSNNEMIAFSELMHKQMSIDNLSDNDQKVMMSRILQSLSTGGLSGSNALVLLNTIPTLKNNIEDYYSTVNGRDETLEQILSKEKITKDVMLNVVINSSDKINKKYESLPTTWGQSMNNATSNGKRLFESFFNQFNELKESSDAFDIIASSWLLLGVVRLLQVLVPKIGSLTSGAILGTIGGFKIIIVGMILALITAIFSEINKQFGTSLSISGILAGIFNFVVYAVENLILDAGLTILEVLSGIFIGISEWIENSFNGGFDNIGGIIKNLIGQVVGWILTVFKVLGRVIDIFLPDSILKKFSFTDKFDEWIKKVRSWGKNDKAVSYDYGIGKGIERNNVWEKAANAYREGYKFEKGLFGGAPSDFNELEIDASSYGGLNNKESFNQIFNSFNALQSGQSAVDIMNNKDNETLTMLGADVALLREIVEKESEKETPPQNLTFNFENHVQVKEEVDMNKFMNRLVSQIHETINTSAEGVPLYV